MSINLIHLSVKIPPATNLNPVVNLTFSFYMYISLFYDLFLCFMKSLNCPNTEYPYSWASNISLLIFNSSQHSKKRFGFNVHFVNLLSAQDWLSSHLLALGQKRHSIDSAENINGFWIQYYYYWIYRITSH